MNDQARSTPLPAAVAAAVEAGMNLVRALRESVGYSIDDLAVACGLTADEITDLEVGYMPRAPSFLTYFYQGTARPR